MAYLKITSRVATLNDLHQVNKLMGEFFTYNALLQPENYIAVTESGCYPKLVIESTTGDFIVSEIGNIIVGLVHIEKDTTPPYPSIKSRQFACIVDFIVMEEYRNQNIGHLLMEEARVWAQQQNLEYIELMVLENNTLAQNFYARENFTTVSRTMRLHI